MEEFPLRLAPGCLEEKFVRSGGHGGQIEARPDQGEAIPCALTPATTPPPASMLVSMST